MTFNKQSNARRTPVESKSNRTCNHRITHYDKRLFHDFAAFSLNILIVYSAFLLHVVNAISITSTLHCYCD